MDCRANFEEREVPVCSVRSLLTPGAWEDPWGRLPFPLHHLERPEGEAETDGKGKDEQHDVLLGED